MFILELYSQKEGWNWWEDEEGNMSNYWVTLTFWRRNFTFKF